MNKTRRKTRKVNLGKLGIGSKFPISVGGMLKSRLSERTQNLIKEINNLEQLGCEVIRVALRNESQAKAIKQVKSGIKIPLVADIHFNYRLALEAIRQGADAVRLNPGNIYRSDEIAAVAKLAKKRKIPIRVGVNSGSLKNTQYPTTLKLRRAGPIRNTQYKHKLSKLKFNYPIAKRMVQSAVSYIELLESWKFYDIIVSLKSCDVLETIEAYRNMAKLCDYPFHLGITASGLPQDGIIKSSLGIGSLLQEGIGDTIRVSLTGSSQEEIRVAKGILQALGLRNFGPEIIACPTCGRTQIDVVKISREFSNKLFSSKLEARSAKPIKVAIMGCEVNGPGEAKQADLGIAGATSGSAALFKKGKIITKVKSRDIVKILLKEVTALYRR